MKLSIITVCCNNLEGLERTSQSIFGQTVHDKFEWVVVDGASTDGTPQWLEDHDLSIDIWVSEPDKGIYNAMNKGVRMASGKYCLFLNSGDSLHDERVIENILPLLDGTSIVCGSMKCEGNITEPVSLQHNTFAIFFKDSICHPASFIKKKLLIKHPYDESLKIVSDWKFWIETLILENETYKTVPFVISNFEVGGVSCSNIEVTKKEREKVLRDLIPARILDDYNRIFNNADGNLYWYILNSHHRGKIYSLLVRLFKIIGRITKMPVHVMKLPNSLN